VGYGGEQGDGVRQGAGDGDGGLDGDGLGQVTGVSVEGGVGPGLQAEEAGLLPS
jgi:hypothetical protein